jgi:hypothetical protein
MRIGAGFIIGITLGTVATGMIFKKPIKKCVLRAINKF